MLALSVFLALAAGFSVYCYLSVFFRVLRKNANIPKLIRQLTGREKVLYGFLILSVFGLIAYVFLTFQYSYMASVYSSDAYNLFTSKNAFLYLSNTENDLRQPLFAMLAAPFNGAPYAVARLFPQIPALKAVFMNWAQYLMVFVAHLLLAEMMNLKAEERICFLFLIAVSYPYIFVGVIIEQYMVTYFYLILALYVLSKRRECNPLIFCGASGSLLTGLVLAPLFSDASPFRDSKKWLSDMRRLFVSFALFFIIACKLKYIPALSERASAYRTYMSGVPFREKILQYFNFLSACLISPTDVVIVPENFDLAPVTRLNVIGLFALILLCVSFALNFKDSVCRYAFGWVAFSFLILCVIGWGTVENILPLYSPYFSWACLALLYRLFQKIAEKFHCKWILYICCAAMGLFLLYRNIQGVRVLITFFAQYTPSPLLQSRILA